MKSNIEDLTKLQHKRRTAGGSATGGGINFQAAVTTISYIYMARGCPLLWLDKLADDTPIAVEVETGGAGDDLRLLLKDTQSVEVQVKKGLRSGPDLWEALIKLAKAVTNGTASFGVLAVSPTSSNTITNKLATDIIRIGDGCTDGYSDISLKFLQKLESAQIPPREACARIRIITIQATSIDQEAIRTARAELTHLCANGTQVGAAWDALYRDASHLIELHSRREVSSLLCVLISSGITLSEKETTIPAIMLTKLTKWTLNTHAFFSIFGVGIPLKLDEAWIPLTAVVHEEPENESDCLAEELKRYQNWENRSTSRDDRSVDPETICRFVNRAVVVAGPGMGKTTLLKRIARRYSEDAIPVLRVKLSIVATRMRGGASFEESIFHLGLDGSGISVADAQRFNFPNWLLLCDGLDECGTLQENVAAGIARFGVGHPGCRILVTTRPIGYRATIFKEWQHYDLPALDPWEAYKHAVKLVESIATPCSDLYKNAWEVCRLELQDTAAAKIVGRTPLLLSLAAAIIVRGKSLGATPERLFEQIFELIDEAPNSRIPEKPAMVRLLRRFLDILGWEMTCYPLSSINETIDRCAAHLAREMGTKLMVAEGDAERYLYYWQDVGMIERICHSDQQTLAFIHKSFGEFAAARRLLSLSRAEQIATIDKILGIPAWAEVLRFAGMLGLASLVTDQLLTSCTIEASTVKRISMALELIAEADPPPDAIRRCRIFEEAFKIVISDRRSSAFEVGLPLNAAARRFPEEVSPMAAAHTGSEHAWTRLIAWACLVTAGPEYYSVDDLTDILRSSTNAAGPSWQASLGGGVLISHGNGHKLAESFILDACTTIIDKSSSDIADKVVPEVLNTLGFGSVRFYQKVQNLLHDKKKNYRIDYLEKLNNTQYNIPRGYFEASSAMFEVIFDVLDLPMQVHFDESSCPRPLLHLSAFIEASQMNEVPASDIWVWSRPFDQSATRTTLQGFIAISGINLEMLKRDAMYAKHQLNRDGGTSTSVFNLTVRVDPPPLDWSRAKTLCLDVAMIERAIEHPSQWIKWLAANLLVNILEMDDLKQTVERLFEKGSNLTLWAACILASKIDREDALALIFERLSKPLSQGCEYLFEFLREKALQQSELLLAPINFGLLTGDVATAVAAAKLAADVATPALNSLVLILEDGFLYWLSYEKPYPKSGVIPESPRVKIIEALIKIRPSSYEEIKSYLLDTRSDVRDIGAKILVDHLRLAGSARLQFFRDIEFGELSGKLLGVTLRGDIPLEVDEIAEVERLLVNPDKHIRYGAMALLNEHYLTRDKIRTYADAMTRDSEQQIKDRAFAILDRS